MLLGQSSQDKTQALKGRVKCLAATQTGNRRQDGDREGRVGKEKNQMLGSKMPLRDRMAAFSGPISKSVV